VSLFSDVDWIIIVAIGAFLLFGDRGHAFVRQLGRLYGRFLRLKGELMSDLQSAAGLPASAGAGSLSLRQALLGDDLVGATAGVSLPSGSVQAHASPELAGPVMPAIVTQAAPLNLRSVETLSYGAAFGPGTWSVATTSNPGEVVWLR
jgi:hypothetical protein